MRQPDRAGPSGHWRAVDSAPPSAQRPAVSSQPSRRRTSGDGASTGRTGPGGRRRADKKERWLISRERAGQVLRLDLAHRQHSEHARTLAAMRTPLACSALPIRSVWSAWAVATAT